MQWSMDAANSHVLLNKTRSEHFKSLPFADSEVQSTTQTKYLGINITAQGIDRLVEPFTSSVGSSSLNTYCQLPF